MKSIYPAPDSLLPKVLVCMNSPCYQKKRISPWKITFSKFLQVSVENRRNTPSRGVNRNISKKKKKKRHFLGKKRKRKPHNCFRKSAYLCSCVSVMNSGGRATLTTARTAHLSGITSKSLPSKPPARS